MIDWPALVRLFPKNDMPPVGTSADDIARVTDAWQSALASGRIAQRSSQVNWRQLPGAPVALEPYSGAYTVIGVDGSQIYPDRHEGLRCALTNTAAVTFHYGPPSSYTVETVPQLVRPEQLVGVSEQALMVDALRHEHELAHGLALAGAHERALLLFDGSLIFWHVLNMGGDQARLDALMRILRMFASARIPVAWYTSLPGSNQLVRLLQTITGQHVGCVTDADLMSAVLAPYQRGQLFEPVHPLLEQYPSDMRPAVAYVHAGTEIARVEMPAWIADDDSLSARVVSMIIDQCNKGNGYPISLAHAHEHAVVTATDRARFFRFIERTLYAHGARRAVSRKQASKRRLHI